MGATYPETDVNGADLLSTREENFKDAVVSEVGPLTLLSEEIKNLSRENKPEARAVFFDHNAYCVWEDHRLTSDTSSA